MILPVPGNNHACAKQDTRKGCILWAVSSVNVEHNHCPVQIAFQQQKADEMVASQPHRSYASHSLIGTCSPKPENEKTRSEQLDPGCFPTAHRLSESSSH